MVLTLIALLTLSATPTPNEIVARVQATYRKAGNLEARFTQTYIDKLRGKKREESGRLWATTDGRLRWSYEKPTAKDFIYDGKVAYFYEPENSQVTRFDRFQDSPLSNAVRFLWGQGNITELFEVKLLAAACDAVAPGDWAVELWPKEALATVDHTVLVVDAKSERVKASVVYDPLGNRTTYTFADLVFGAKIKDAKFQFEVPKGVAVLKADSDADKVPSPALKSAPQPTK